MSFQIPRTVVNQMLTKAMSVSSDEMLWGLYDIKKQCCKFFNREPELSVDALLDFALVYNQSPVTTDSVEQLQAKILNDQKMIEIFEETKGVVGLRAHQKNGKMLNPLALEITH